MTERMWAVALVIAGVAGGCGESEREVDGEGPRRVVLISLDTLRADHLGTYAYPRLTSPNLDRLGEEGVVFEQAFAQASWTLPSHMSLLTGLYPDTHGVVHTNQRLAPEVETLAEILSSRGMATAGFVDNGYMAADYGFSDGFDTYDDNPDIGNGGPQGLHRSLPLIETWLDEHGKGDFFLFVHTFDVHGPYQAPPEVESEYRERVAASVWGADREYLRSLENLDYIGLDQYRSLDDLIADYDAGIRHTDEMVGRLFELLKSRGLYDETLIIVTSDHGESFFEDGVYIGHGVLLTEAELHVPLLMKLPRGRFAGRRVEEVVESIDVMPTILETLHVPSESFPPMQGDSLRPLLHGLAEGWEPLAFASHAYAQTWSLRTPQWTLISPLEPWIAEGFVTERLEPADPQALLDRLPQGYQLYRAGKWPAENLASAQPRRVEALKKQLLRWKEDEIQFRQQIGEAKQRRDFHDWEIDYLRRLGYLGPK